MLHPPDDLPKTSLVDPFLGTAETDLPKPEGIAAKWWRPKPPVGNTHPGATLPFGMVSACAYSGAYVTGYGRYNLSLDGGPPPVLFPRHEALGIAHFQQSGTGRIRMYYNYLLTTPIGQQGLASRTTRQPLTEEVAWPGYHAGKFETTGTRFEVTATPRGVIHRYHFPDGTPPHLAIDVSAGGLLVDDMTTYPQGAEINILDDDTVTGHVVMEGIPIHFHARCPGAKPYLWENDEPITETTYPLTLEKQKHRPTFGFAFKTESTTSPTIELTLGFSIRSAERATDALSHLPFPAATRQAAKTWEQTLSAITIEGGTPTQRQVFTTALYHAAIKPADFHDENPFTRADGPFFLDLSTLWDLYKTQLPLMMSLWPDRGAAFVEFLCEIATREGAFPISYLMDNVPDRFTKQATGLCHAILEDARIRGIPGDWDRALALLWKTSQSRKGRKSRFEEYAETHIATPLSHTLDIAYAHFCMARMARGVGDQAIHDRAAAHAVHWKNAFDPATGLLREDSTYYEGENWNYSFRFLHDMQARIELAGGANRFTALLDKFFGFSEPAHGERLFRFEGLNNEPDMEAPYAYLYAGRHDRTARVVRRVMDCQFTTGPGGLPGNDDSGGLSSWFVWTACGLFPVTGQPVMLIGSPLFPKATLHLPAGDFTIIAENNGPENVHIHAATLNGNPLRRAWLHLHEFQNGGTLHLTMSNTPTDFGSSERPPSFGKF